MAPSANFSLSFAVEMDKSASATIPKVPLTADPDLEASIEKEQKVNQGVSRGAFITVSSIFGVLLLLILYIVFMTARRVHAFRAARRMEYDVSALSTDDSNKQSDLGKTPYSYIVSEE